MKYPEERYFLIPIPAAKTSRSFKDTIFTTLDVQQQLVVRFHHGPLNVRPVIFQMR